MKAPKSSGSDIGMATTDPADSPGTSPDAPAGHIFQIWAMAL
ncbi:hypothetical protein CSC29_3374 [Pseudomonas aeruginosa]|uniref:Uncharacterized protein n=1 Tax=Pseudomonas paraeruginosa TaxID=2994495 RepID=A0A2R3ILG8_9PSED|nr:hypothetical protein CSB93_5033 [Pseudomonas paraeruginosa]AWE87842.1 hypothetical protein CSC29_3374 [Pseudomonas aeruginosa]AWE95502.1 hypothetical protein CSC28_3825 [Pseudomonas paraeruginosa]